jgi:hypothetical protein
MLPQESNIAINQSMQHQHLLAVSPGYFDLSTRQKTTCADQNDVKAAVLELITFVSSVGNMLKGKTFQGAQCFGRHETLHVELEQRLNKASEYLGS